MAQGKLGRPIELDQCPTCAGIWFDRGELYQIGGGFAQRFEGRDPCPVASLQASDGRGHCPGCGGTLERHENRRFPQTLHVSYCRSCGGFWLSEEDLYEFYQFRSARLSALKAEQQERERRRQDPSPEVVARVAAEMAADVGKKVIVPAAMFAAPPWIAMGLVLVERLAPTLRRLFRGEGRPMK